MGTGTVGGVLFTLKWGQGEKQHIYTRTSYKWVNVNV